MPCALQKYKFMSKDGDWPEAAGHEEEVDDHEEDGAAPVLHVSLPDRPLFHQITAYRHLD